MTIHYHTYVPTIKHEHVGVTHKWSFLSACIMALSTPSSNVTLHAISMLTTNTSIVTLEITSYTSNWYRRLPTFEVVIPYVDSVSAIYVLRLAQPLSHRPLQRKMPEGGSYLAVLQHHGQHHHQPDIHSSASLFTIPEP